MSVIKRIIQDSIERVKVDEVLGDEYEAAGYGGITLTKTPLGTQINLHAMRPGRVIGRRGRAIREASERLETELGLPNPQITVIEVEIPEMNPQIMASRVANALERGVHFRRAIFWSLRRIMDSGALGCEVILKGPLRSSRSRFEKVVEGYVPKSGDPALTYVRTATMHVKMKRGILGVTVSIVPPDAKFPDKVDLTGLPEIEYEPPTPKEETITEESAEPADTKIEETPETIQKIVEEEKISDNIIQIKDTREPPSENLIVPTKEETEDVQPRVESDPIDLEMLEGIGATYQKLLKALGIKNIISLATENPENLLKKIKLVNEKEKITRRPPSLSSIEEWIAKASKIIQNENEEKS
jgi:small subunit ribosomal protein S3